eukprot:3323826-Rhodomonas_salina.2
MTRSFCGVGAGHTNSEGVLCCSSFLSRSFTWACFAITGSRKTMPSGITFRSNKASRCPLPHLHTLLLPSYSGRCTIMLNRPSSSPSSVVLLSVSVPPLGR